MTTEEKVLLAEKLFTEHGKNAGAYWYSLIEFRNCKSLKLI